jgi:hypothetical protein
VDFGAHSFSLLNSGVLVLESMEGATYRFDVAPGAGGFYYGFEYTAAFPTLRIVAVDWWDYAYQATPYRSYSQLSVPLGYRWEGKGKKSGFFLGGAPTATFLYGFEEKTVTGLGFLVDLGFQTNMTEGTAFHFVFQNGWSPWVFREDFGLLESDGFTSSLRFGISWRRIEG